MKQERRVIFMIMVMFCLNLTLLFAQNINLSLSNTTVKNAIETLKKNYGYSFVFESGDVDTRKVISVKAQDQPVDAVVKQILYGQDVSYEIKEKNIIVRKTVHAPVQLVTQQQGKRITGVVADTNGEPVIGANVVEKGTTNGTVTDVDGRFSLAVSNNATLVVSFIGYNAQELVVGDQTDLKIILAESSLGLDEVVVVGYGTQKKVNLTGSVSTISAEKLTQTPSANLTNAMAGRLSGVIATNKNGLPGSGSDLQVRGLSTLNNNQPLIVIDGIIGRDLSNIDPNEIQSISVLKDASSSVYGARAANGVFLVTTKRGTIGKPKISYTGMVGIQQPTQYPELMNAYQWAYTRNQAMRNQGYDPSNPAQASMFFTDQQMADFQSGKVGTDWYDQTMKKNSMQTQHNLSVNGGSEMIRYFMSLGYLNQDGMFDNIGFRRYNLRANVDAKITQHLDVGANLEGRQMNYHTPGNGVSKIFNDLLWVQPTFKSPYHPDGKPADTGGEHPLEDIKSSGYDRQTTGEYQGTLFFDYRLPFITPGLSLKGNASLYKQIFFSKRFFTPFALYQEDAEGNVTSINQRGTISLSEEVRQLNAFNYNISLNYAHTFKKHDVAALLLFEQSEETGDNLNGSRQDFSTTIKDELYASGTANQTISGTSVLNEARRSVVGRINYAFSSKYLLEFSFRYDGSYRFPKETRFGFFPSVSAGWRISEESFFKNSSALQFVDNLKIRGAKGLIGNDRINAFQFTDAYSINSASGPVFGGTSQTLVNYGVYPNPYITWEKQDNNNLGLDASLWRGKLTAEIDIFYRKTTDILWSRVRSVPGTFGRNLPNENYAQMQSSGFEINLGHQGKTGGLLYSVQLIGSYANNKVTQIDDPSNSLDYEKQLNRPLGLRVGYEALGLFQSDEEATAWYGGKQFSQESRAGDIKYADLDGDNEITNRDQKVLSNNGFDPKIVYGLSAGLKWKGFDLDILAQGAAARTLLLEGTGRVTFRNTSNNFAYLFDSWSPENKGAQYPLAWTDSRTINDRVSSVWLKKAAYLRLKSASIGYTVSQNWLKQNGIDHLRIYISGFNLLTWSQVKEMDPEAQTGTGQYYPQQRNLNIGVNLSF